MSPVKKIIPALGLVLLIAFGTFAVSLAQDLPSSGTHSSLQLRGVLQNGSAQMDSYTLSVGMNSETGDLSNSLSPESDLHRVAHSQHFKPRQLSITQRPYAAKVPIQLLDLVLLI
jgi:hypothetical protein